MIFHSLNSIHLEVMYGQTYPLKMNSLNERRMPDPVLMVVSIEKRIVEIVSVIVVRSYEIHVDFLDKSYDYSTAIADA